MAAWDVLLQRSKVAVRSQQQGHGELKLQVHLGGYDEYSSHSVTAREGDGALELSLTARMLSVLRTTEEVWSASLKPLKAGGPVQHYHDLGSISSLPPELERDLLRAKLPARAHTGTPHCGSHCRQLGVCLTPHFLWQAEPHPNAMRRQMEAVVHFLRDYGTTHSCAVVTGVRWRPGDVRALEVAHAHAPPCSWLAPAALRREGGYSLFILEGKERNPL